jgi:hypothetical protein
MTAYTTVRKTETAHVIIVPGVGGFSIYGCNTPEEIEARIAEMREFNRETCENLAQIKAESERRKIQEEMENGDWREKADHREWLDQLAEMGR